MDTMRRVHTMRRRCNDDAIINEGGAAARAMGEEEVGLVQWRCDGKDARSVVVEGQHGRCPVDEWRPSCCSFGGGDGDSGGVIINIIVEVCIAYIMLNEMGLQS